MTKASIIFLTVIIATTGCKVQVREFVNDIEKTSVPIATYDEIPKTLTGIPRYPETPDKITVREYETGWHMEHIVQNPYAIARAAWVTALQEQLWQLANEVVVNENNFSWITMEKDTKIIFLKIQGKNNEQTVLTTFIKK